MIRATVYSQFYSQNCISSNLHKDLAKLAARIKRKEKKGASPLTGSAHLAAGGGGRACGARWAAAGLALWVGRPTGRWVGGSGHDVIPARAAGGAHAEAPARSVGSGRPGASATARRRPDPVGSRRGGGGGVG